MVVSVRVARAVHTGTEAPPDKYVRIAYARTSGLEAAPAVSKFVRLAAVVHSGTAFVAPAGRVRVSRAVVEARPVSPFRESVLRLVDAGANARPVTLHYRTVTGFIPDLPDVAAAPPPAYLRGVNVAGGEFASESAATLPGVYDQDYKYDPPETFTFLAARGHKVVRLPFRWERIQRTLGGPLDSAELARLQGVVASIGAAGMRVILDVHNYGRYIDGTGTRVLGAGLTTAHFADLWTRLAAAFKGNATVAAYDLMNEPHDLVAQPGAFVPSGTPYTFDTDLQGWSGEGDAVVTRDTVTRRDGPGALKVTRSVTTGVNGQTIRVNDGAGNTLVESNGSTISMWLRRETTGGTARARLEMQNSAFAWQAGPGVVLTPGVWTQVTYTPPSSVWTGHRGVGFQVDIDGATTSAQVVHADTFQQGTSSGALTGAQVWERDVQAAALAVSAVDPNVGLWIEGHGYSGAKTWAQNHPAPFVTVPNPVTYSAHYYFDRDNSGDYPDTYAAETADATGRGYPSLAARATSELSTFVNWCTGFFVKGSIGEIGWPKNGDTAGWNAVGEAIYDLLDAASIGATYWATGERWGTGYNLSIYHLPAGTINAQATTVEAHPTTNVITQPSVSRTLPNTFYSAFGMQDSLADMQQAKTAGMTHVVLPLYWDRLESTSGVLDVSEVANVKSRLANAASAGLGVIVYFGVQYAPDWAQVGTKYRSETGAEHTGTGIDGDKVIDLPWSALARERVASWVGRLWTALSPAERAQIVGVRVGGGPYGELHYPISPRAWWGYSPAAQTGTGLAAGALACPHPGYVPFTGDGAKDAAWLTWYLDSLTRSMLWQIQLVRDIGYRGSIHVLHPGFGLRATGGSFTFGGADYREQAKEGVDYRRQLAAYPDVEVHPQGTWADGTDPFDPEGDQVFNVESDMAAWRFLLLAATEAGRTGLIAWENTGGQTNTDMDRMFSTAGALSTNRRRLTWLDFARLVGRASSSEATLARLSTYMQASVTAPTPPPPPVRTTLTNSLQGRQTAPVRVLSLGSSTPNGVGATEPSRGVFNLLVSAMQASYPSTGAETTPVLSVSGAWGSLSTLGGIHGYNAAEGGRTSADVLSSGVASTLTSLRPKVVTLMVGANDWRNSVTPDTYKTNMLARIAEIRALVGTPCSFVLVHTHERTDAFTRVATWADYGSKLAEIAAASPSDVAYVDASAAFEAAGVPGADPQDLLGTDGIHLTNAGHLLLASVIRQSLELPAPVVAPPPTVLASDNFNRPDAASLGTAVTGQTWTTSGTWSIVSNKAQGSGSAFVTGAADVDASIVVTFSGATGGSLGVTVNAADASNRLSFYVDNGNPRLGKLDAGSLTVLGTAASTTITAGTTATLRIVSKGSVITCYLNGALVLTYTLTTAEATKYKALSLVGLRQSAAAQGSIDDFVVTAPS